MATCLEKLRRAERWRVKAGQFGSSETDGFNGHFLVPLDGELWFCRISDGWGWRHVSVSNAQRKMLPTWAIMCRVKEAFFSDESWVVQYHPAKTDYVNDHELVLHLWEPLEENLPHPPVILV
jgi:hypothetical protein